MSLSATAPTRWGRNLVEEAQTASNVTYQVIEFVGVSRRQQRLGEQSPISRARDIFVCESLHAAQKGYIEQEVGYFLGRKRRAET